MGVDRDEHKVNSVLAGKAPFYEPGLEEIVREGVAAGTLSATTTLAAALLDSDVAMICVGTPSAPNGNLDVDQLRRVVAEVADAAPRLRRDLVLAVRSTVYPGTCEEVVMQTLGNNSRVQVVSNPEFLREGIAVQDFMEPSLLVVGGTSAAAVAKVAALYEKLPVTPCLVSLRTAEMIKYACNAFHAVKISFANEIGALCSSMDIPAPEVMSTLCQDVKLNVSPAYLKPGFAFGGSCLPKDLRALVHRAARLDVRLPMLEAVLPSNEAHLQRSKDAAMALPAGEIGIYGLAFKENTDDLRESPVVTLVEYLIGKGRDVRIYDPHIRLEAIYGSNLNFVMAALPHIGRLMVGSLAEMLAGSRSIIITQKPPADVRQTIEAAALTTLDFTTAWKQRAGASAR